MIILKTDSDIGSVLIGNSDWTFAVPNVGGDGETTVLILNKEKVKRNDKTQSDGIEVRGKFVRLKFIASVQGKFGIYGYDCAFNHVEELEEPLTILSGRYGVYQGDMCIAFERWK